MSFGQGYDIAVAIVIGCIAVQCDIVVLEAGLGGLLDCTNIIEKSCVSVITSISLDHTAILGDTVEKIAVQKAGIIKRECPLVLALQQQQAVYGIMRETAAKITDREVYGMMLGDIVQRADASLVFQMCVLPFP